MLVTLGYFVIYYNINNAVSNFKVLSEAYRVLRPGGKFACLEFSNINPLLKPFYDLYSFQIIPVMGQIIAGDFHSYRYLVESIRKFPNQVNLHILQIILKLFVFQISFIYL